MKSLNILGFILSLFLTVGPFYVQPSLAGDCGSLFEAEEDLIIGLGETIKDKVIINGKPLAPKDINKIFKLNSRKNLAFATPPDNYLDPDSENPDEIQVIELKYHEGLSRGIVYVSNFEDIENHLAGFVRIAKTKAWRNTKNLLRDLFKITKNKKISKLNRDKAQELIGDVAHAVEAHTAILSLGDRYVDYVPANVKKFESEINIYLGAFEKLKTRIQGETK